jgi:hypothetical protein
VDGLAYHNIDLAPERTLRQNYIASLSDGKRSARSIARSVNCSPRTVGRFRRMPPACSQQVCKSQTQAKHDQQQVDERTPGQFIYDELRKDNCQAQLAAQISQLICQNCSFSSQAYSFFYEHRRRAHEFFDPAKSRVKHIYALMLGIVKQWVNRKNETPKERQERIKRVQDQKHPPIVLDRSKKYRVGDEQYYFDPASAFWFRRHASDPDEFEEPLQEAEMEELIKEWRWAG